NNNNNDNNNSNNNKEKEKGPEERAQLVRNHLLQVHEQALASLQGWNGPYPADTGQSYYYNEGLQVSTWISPIERWECELAIRHSVLRRCLLAGHPGMEDMLNPSRDKDPNDILH
ncbi:unnamed protein product, partial [Polarella glacialis]